MGCPGKDSELSSPGNDQVYSGKDTESTSNSGAREYSGLHSELHSTSKSQNYSGKDSELMPAGNQECSGKDSDLRSPNVAVQKPQGKAKVVLEKGKDSKFIIAKPLYPQKLDSRKKLPEANKSK